MGKELLKLAESVARATGSLLMNRPESFTLTEKSSAVDFATQMDQQAEEMIVKLLLEQRPDDGIVAEEGAARQSKSGITWVIDPIDGTVNYLYGLPGWNVSIAAKDKDGVVVGVVYAPSINGFWSAIRSEGATYNGNKIKCNDPVALEKALIATGFAYDLNLRNSQGKIMSNLLPKIRDLRRNGAAAVDLCYVAMGAIAGWEWIKRDRYFDKPDVRISLDRELHPQSYDRQPNNRLWHTSDESQVVLFNKVLNYINTHNLLEWN